MENVLTTISDINWRFLLLFHVNHLCSVGHTESQSSVILPAQLCDHHHFFCLFAGPAQSGERKNLVTQLAVGAAKRLRCSTIWLTSCLYPTASVLTWTRPPSWGSQSASCAHASCSPQVRRASSVVTSPGGNSYTWLYLCGIILNE